MSYELTFRKRKLEYLSKGNIVKNTAETFGISTRTLNSWILKSKVGDLLWKKRKQGYRDALEDYIDKHLDAYQGEVAQHFHCSQQCVC